MGTQGADIHLQLYRLADIVVLGRYEGRNLRRTYNDIRSLAHIPQMRILVRIGQNRMDQNIRL